MYEIQKTILPEFPRTMHLPLEPNASSDDKVASAAELVDLLKQTLYITEKVDAANCGVAMFEGMPIVRNRNHILNKSYVSRKTPAQQQFSRVWTWLYENVDKIQRVEKLTGGRVSVFGEWMFAAHPVFYDSLPGLFLAYDIFDADAQKYLAPELALPILQEAGFDTVPQIAHGRFDVEDLLDLRDGPSKFSTTNPREGIYIKASDGEWCSARYKMVAPWFKSDDNWNKQQLVKNKCSV